MLLGKHITAKLFFHNHVKILWCKDSLKLNALSRVAPYMKLSQPKITTKGFIISQFGYCSLV